MSAEFDRVDLACPAEGLPDLALVTLRHAGRDGVIFEYRRYLRATVAGQVTYVPAIPDTLSGGDLGRVLAHPELAAASFQMGYAPVTLTEEFARLTAGPYPTFALPDRAPGEAVHDDPVLTISSAGRQGECRWGWMFHYPHTRTGHGTRRCVRGTMADARWDDLDGIAGLIEMGTRPDSLRAMAWMLAHSPEKGTR